MPQPSLPQPSTYRLPVSLVTGQDGILLPRSLTQRDGGEVEQLSAVVSDLRLVRSQPASFGQPAMLSSRSNELLGGGTVYSIG